MAKITLTESELTNVIMEAVNQYMLNEGADEGFLNNLRAGFQAGKNAKIDHQEGNPKDAYDMVHQNLSQRIKAGKQGFNLQKQYSKMDKLKQELQQLVQDGIISPRQTVNQLLNYNVGAKQNKNLGQGAKGFGGAKSDYQRQAKNMGVKLTEDIQKAVDKALNEALDEILNEQTNKEN